MLILNAGIFGAGFSNTEDGLESTFQVNYLSQFYLTRLLRDKLIESKPSRLVVLSSESHRFSLLKKESLDESQLSRSAHKFNHATIYNDTKLCNILFVKQFNSDYQNYGINSYAVHPGNMISSEISRNWWVYKIAFTLARPFTKSLVIFFLFFIKMALSNFFYISNKLQLQQFIVQHLQI